MADKERVQNERRRFLRLIKKIYKVLETEEWKIFYKQMENLAGRAFLKEKIILIDPSRDILPTLIHECLHILFYEKVLDSAEGDEEEEVKKLERFCEEHLDQQYAIVLTKLLFKNLIVMKKGDIELLMSKYPR